VRSVARAPASCASNGSVALQPAELHPRGCPSVAIWNLLDDLVEVELAGAPATLELDVWGLFEDLAALELAGLVHLREDGRVEVDR